MQPITIRMRATTPRSVYWQTLWNYITVQRQYRKTVRKLYKLKRQEALKPANRGGLIEHLTQVQQELIETAERLEKKLRGLR